MKLSELITKHGDKDINEIPYFIKLDDLQCLVSVATKVYEDGVNAEKKAEIKKIDMSRCIESGIDCEFSDDRNFPNGVIGKLIEIVGDDGFTFRKSSLHEWTHCRPRMNHIHACPEGFDECPLPDGFKVNLWSSESKWESITTPCSGWNWPTMRTFEVTGIADGYEL